MMATNEPSIHHKRTVALAGNPNSGKTTLFNALTGLRQKVGNYAGVTVERKTGSLRLPNGEEWDVLDLPGTYSLTARSPEEAIARNVLLGEMSDTPRPDAIVIVLDASNLDRNLYLATQILEMGLPTVLALNMTDVAEGAGIKIDADALAEKLGVPVVPMIASRDEGVDRLKKRLTEEIPKPPSRQWRMNDATERAISKIADALRGTTDLPPTTYDAEAIRLIGMEGEAERITARGGERLAEAVADARKALADAGQSTATFEAENRYVWIRSVTRGTVQKRDAYQINNSDRADAVLTNRVLGP
ncbi:MAG: 50S ribosome-binding GTPase, partial [Candidatus Poribacteria bacterium]|nr:50S ribosome-binding GTPase [Candidatus Poribacteria bacterium]